MRNYQRVVLGAALMLALTGCGSKAAGVTTDSAPGSQTAAASEQATGESSTQSSDSAAETGDTAGGTDSSSEPGKEAVTFTDGLGHQVTVKPTDHAAVFSESFADCWTLAGGKLDAVTSDVYQTDQVKVPETAVNLGMLKSPSVELLVGSGAEFAILSANIEEHVALRDTLEKAGIVTAYFNVETFEDYLNMLKNLTDITGRKDLYQKNGTDIQSEIDKQVARQDGSHPTVLFLRAFSSGVRAKGSANMTGEMLKDLGCINIADDDKGLLDDLSMESIIAQDPDYIFVTTMGSSEDAAMKSVQDMLVSNPAWKDLKAVKSGHYYVLPKALFHNKPNKRWGESYRILADILYGEDEKHKSESN